MSTPQRLRARSSPHLDLIRLADLPPERREKLRELERDPDFYGLLVARAPLSMNLQAVPRSTAALFLALSSPQSVALDEELIDLVLDGVLEIESEDGFVSGADAMAGLGLAADDGACPDRRSRLALRHAEDLETADAPALTMALYRYNRMPLTPFWRSRLANADAILAFLGADRGALRTLLEREWTASRRSPGWLSWFSRGPQVQAAGAVTHKLYVSPRPERMPEVFAVAVRVLAEFAGTQFKIGDHAAGLLRPDKFVAYFVSGEQLDAAASTLARELAGCDAHGVPFTAALDETGLLSCGVDPPDGERALRWLGGESWRLWVSRRLGTALAIAKLARTSAAIEPWRFALVRARRHGIDVEHWTPSAALWSPA